MITKGFDVFEQECPRSDVLLYISKPVLFPFFFASVSSPRCYLVYLEFEPNQSTFRRIPCLRIIKKASIYGCLCLLLLAPHVLSL